MPTQVPRFRNNTSIRDSLDADGLWRYQADECEWGAMPVCLAPHKHIYTEESQASFVLTQWYSVFIVTVVCTPIDKPRSVFACYFAVIAESTETAVSYASDLAGSTNGENEVIRAYGIDLRSLLAAGIVPRAQIDLGNGEQLVDLTTAPLKVDNEKVGYIGSGRGCEGLCESWTAICQSSDNDGSKSDDE